MTPPTTDRLVSILERVRAVRALVIGDIMLDTYLRGSVSRISPEAPVPIVDVRDETHSPGGAANVAVNVTALGATCDLVGMIGRDLPGLELERLLAKSGISPVGLLHTDERPTTVKTRVMAGHQQVARFDREHTEDADDECAADLVARIEQLAPEADVILIEDYDKGVMASAVIREVMALARSLERPVIVDPKARHFFEYGGCTVLKPNRVELTGALRAPVPADDADAMEEIRRRLGCDNLLVTLGEQGMVLAPGRGAPLRIPSAARSVYDVSGAGDTVTAVVGLALAAGATMSEAAVLANFAAGLEVAKSGVATVGPEELAESIRSAVVYA